MLQKVQFPVTHQFMTGAFRCCKVTGERRTCVAQQVEEVGTAEKQQQQQQQE
jgi:hypothetical protein